MVTSQLSVYFFHKGEENAHADTKKAPNQIKTKPGLRGKGHEMIGMSSVLQQYYIMRK